MAGAPKGNTNSAKGRLLNDALKRAISRKYGDLTTGLDALAMRFINSIETEDKDSALAKFRELADRLDGKPAQAVTVAGDEDGGPIKSLNEIVIRGIDVSS